MKKIAHLIMLSCRKATELIEKQFVAQLSLKERVQLNLHKSICDACTAYEKQSRLLNDLLKKQASATPDQIAEQENEALKANLLKQLPLD
ncbi:MAG: hypothetical protein I8H66_01150 [Sphingobacteriia bacterium]|nr:hypothetical protein [Sphingobacteriia bacterium]